MENNNQIAAKQQELEAKVDTLGKENENDFVEENSTPSLLPISDKDLPPIIREIVTNAPKSRKLPSFVAALSPLCALATRVRLRYFHDPHRPHALLLQVVIEGAQSSGKSFAADIENLIMATTLKARDKVQRRIEQEYREKKKRRSQNKELEEEPKTTIRVIPATVSKTVLTKRADMFKRIFGDTLTFFMFAEELAQVTDAGKNGYSNLRTIMRTAYDLGSEFGLDFASDNSYAAIVDINICSLFCATPAALDNYYDSQAIEGGNITRCIVCELDDNITNDDEFFTPYSPQQKEKIDYYLQRIMSDTYDENDDLQPQIYLDMRWLDNHCKKFLKDKADEYSLSGNDAIKVFRKRASVSAFRIAALCYYLYSFEWEFDPREGATNENIAKMKRARNLCKKVYNFMAEYIIKGLLNRWGQRYNELNKSRQEANQPTSELFSLLPDEFTREDLKAAIDKVHCTSPVKSFIYRWGPKFMNIIEKIDKNHFRKIKK